MIRKHEDPDKFKAGVLAVLVHLVLLGGMLISFNWKAAHQMLSVTEVELWDRLPASKAAPALPEPKPVLQEKPEPKPEPKPVVEEKPEPKAEEKVDIELEKKKRELAEKEKQLAEKKKQEELKRQEEKKLAELKKKEFLQTMRNEDLPREAPKNDALKKLQAEVSGEASEKDSAAKSTANARLVGEYRDKISAKIRGNVNKTLCGDDNPELHFRIALLPTGQLSGSPKLVKSSGNQACDAAVERAIIASEPLPVPSDPVVFSTFRDSLLKFRPND